MVARWRHGAYRVVGLEFHTGTPRATAQELAPHLAQLKYLEFIRLPQSPADGAAKWNSGLPDDYAVLHCRSE